MKYIILIILIFTLIGCASESTEQKELEQKKQEVLEKASQVLPEELLNDLKVKFEGDITMEELIELDSSISNFIDAVNDLPVYECPEGNTLNCVAGGGPVGSEQYNLCNSNDYTNWMFQNCPDAEILE